MHFLRFWRSTAWHVCARYFLFFWRRICIWERVLPRNPYEEYQISSDQTVNITALEYIFPVLEYYHYESSCFQVLAEDQDATGSIRYSTSGIVPAPTYFSIDPETGEISVAKDLTEDRTVIYTVSGLRWIRGLNARVIILKRVPLRPFCCEMSDMKKHHRYFSPIIFRKFHMNIEEACYL